MAPSTIEEVNEIVAGDLKDCDAEQLATFGKYRVEAFSAPILRYGHPESVVVVAQNGDQVIYPEDVEDGFNVSPISADGRVLEHWCNQDEPGLRSVRGSKVAACGEDLGLPCPYSDYRIVPAGILSEIADYNRLAARKQCPRFKRGVIPINECQFSP